MLAYLSSSGMCSAIMGTVSSQSMDQPRMSESLSACSCWSRLGARAHWFGLRRCTFSRGGNCGTLCFPELSSTADDSGRLMMIQAGWPVGVAHRTHSCRLH